MLCWQLYQCLRVSNCKLCVAAMANWATAVSLTATLQFKCEHRLHPRICLALLKSLQAIIILACGSPRAERSDAGTFEVWHMDVANALRDFLQLLCEAGMRSLV